MLQLFDNQVIAAFLIFNSAIPHMKKMIQNFYLPPPEMLRDKSVFQAFLSKIV